MYIILQNTWDFIFICDKILPMLAENEAGLSIVNF